MNDRYQLHLGDCLEVLKSLPDGSVDAVITDPPYGLSFMGKRWDASVPSVEVWEECLRVAKSGAHLLSFAGTRTQHRMACAIEDAGWHIRDMIAWVYGSGFPKSHNLEGDWQGWGTALKPSLEPITLARKPFKGTVVSNVLEHGTGAINVDGCRVHGPDALAGRKRHGGGIAENHSLYVLPDSNHDSPAGRWPANLIHDGSDDVVGLFPVTTSGKPMNRMHTDPGRSVASGASRGGEYFHGGFGDTGSAARFFYCAKASKADRGEDNPHPTVKPTDLMRYLCRLVTPPGGIVLDPYMGSGSTGKAALLEGLHFIGIEREEQYFEIAKRRIEAEARQKTMDFGGRDE